MSAPNDPATPPDGIEVPAVVHVEAYLRETWKFRLKPRIPRQRREANT